MDSMLGKRGKPDVERQNARRIKDPFLLLITASILVAAFWNVLVLEHVFALVNGSWYFLMVWWFYKKTHGRWKWETAFCAVIGLLCYYELFWSRVTPEDMRDAQAGLIIMYGPLFPGMAALLGAAGVALLSFLIRSSFREEEDEK